MIARLLLLLVACTPLVALPQYPSKPIRIVLQFPAGGLADTVVRVLANPMSQGLGQPILVENKPGADGAIAGDFVAKSPPDGYTVMFATNSALSAVPALRKNPPYDPVTDFTPIAMVGRFPFFVFAHPSLPAKSLGELIAHVRANPGKVNYGSGNTTSILATAQLAALAKLDMLHVPYKGDAPLMIDLVAGRLHFSIASTAPGATLATDGKLKVLATLLARRSHLFPDAPTMAEAGFPEYSVTPWGAMLGPAGLARDVVLRLARETNAAVANAAVKEQLDRFGFELQSSTPEELGVFVKDQLAVWRKAVTDAGIQPD